MVCISHVTEEDITRDIVLAEEGICSPQTVADNSLGYPTSFKWNFSRFSTAAAAAFTNADNGDSE